MENGGDTLLYAADLPGAYARGDSKEAALEKMRREIPSFLLWAGCRRPAGRRGAAQPRARRARTPGVKAPAGGFDGLRRERLPLPQTGRKGKTLSHDFRDLPAFCWANPIDFPLRGML